MKASATLKIAVFAPIPSASVRTTNSVKPGLRRRLRRIDRISGHKPSSIGDHTWTYHAFDNYQQIKRLAGDRLFDHGIAPFGDMHVWAGCQLLPTCADCQSDCQYQGIIYLSTRVTMWMEWSARYGNKEAGHKTVRNLQEAKKMCNTLRLNFANLWPKCMPEPLWKRQNEMLGSLRRNALGKLDFIDAQ